MNGLKKTFVFKIAAGIILTSISLFLFSWIFDRSSLQKYPDREPVRFWHMWTADWKLIVDDICTAFNESQDTYEVIPLSLPMTAADSKFLLSVAGGEPPDCMAQWNQVVPKFAASKLIMPIDELMTPAELIYYRKEIYPVAQKIAAYKGRPYCMPMAVDLWSCYYRIDHLKKAGLIPAGSPDRVDSYADYNALQKLLPKTLEELTDWGRRLTRQDTEGNYTRMGFLPMGYYMFAPVFGGGFYDRRKEKLIIQTPENLRTLKYLTSLREEFGYNRIIRFESSLAGTSGADWPFVTGKYSIMVEGQWRIEQLKRFAPEVPYITGPIPPPANEGRRRAGWANGNFMIIPVNSSNPQGAWAFIKFWTGMENPERAAGFYTRGGWLPPSARISETLTYQKYVEENPQLKTVLDMLPSLNLEPTAPVPFQTYLHDRIQRCDESAMRGTLSPNNALQKLSNEMIEEMARLEEFKYEE